MTGSSPAIGDTLIAVTTYLGKRPRTARLESYRVEAITEHDVVMRSVSNPRRRAVFRRDDPTRTKMTPYRSVVTKFVAQDSPDVPVSEAEIRATKSRDALRRAMADAEAALRSGKDFDPEPLRRCVEEYTEAVTR